MTNLLPQLQPYDEHNRALENNVHPREWRNPVPKRPYQLVVIGAGTAGLVTAAGAAGLGVRVALIERELMGGDCLNVGCVPSKSLLCASRMAATVRYAASRGVKVREYQTDFTQVMSRLRETRAKISPHDSAHRFAKLGVDVFFGRGAFEDQNSISVTGEDGSVSRLLFRKAVIATGARAAIPPIPGLDSVDYLTNETVFSLTDLPSRFGVVGGGPIGCEMAQAFARLGSDVHLFANSTQILPREEVQAANCVQRHFERDGIRLFMRSHDMRVSAANEGGIRLVGQAGTDRYDVTVDRLLIATGRAANRDCLGLDNVNVQCDSSGVCVNDFLQSTNPRIFAAGDVCSSHKFTHAADFQARIVLQNALFAIGPLGRRRASQLVIPWTTYTSPELAHVGMHRRDAEAAGISLDTYELSFRDLDRAVLEGDDEGFANIHVRQGTDKVVGATIVGASAGELISHIAIAMTHGLGLSRLANTIYPYPTRSEAIRKLGDQYRRTKLTPVAKRVLGFLKRMNVGT